MKSMIIKSFTNIIFATHLLTIGFNSAAQHNVKLPITNEEWTRDFQPFRIAGNLYYVGTYDLASYLITTPKGHILINTGLAESVPLIRTHVESLGFKFTDIKILLATHAHFDHVAGMAEIKKLTGAKMMIHEKDASVLSDGGNSDFVFGGKGKIFEPVKADRLLHDHDTIRMEGMIITVLHHPGHTHGACSFLLNVKDEYRSYRVLIVNMPSILDQTTFQVCLDIRTSARTMLKHLNLYIKLISISGCLLTPVSLAFT